MLQAKPHSYTDTIPLQDLKPLSRHLPTQSKALRPMLHDDLLGHLLRHLSQLPLHQPSHVSHISSPVQGLVNCLLHFGVCCCPGCHLHFSLLLHEGKAGQGAAAFEALHLELLDGARLLQLSIITKSC